jgi:hypothetical protein
MLVSHEESAATRKIFVKHEFFALLLLAFAFGH